MALSIPSFVSDIVLPYTQCAPYSIAKKVGFKNTRLGF